MQIKKSKRFNTELEEVLEFIAQDNFNAAIDFLEELTQKVDNLSYFPYKNRQSKKSKDKNVRDMIFKGYVIPYIIYDDKIVILGIFNQNRWDF